MSLRFDLTVPLARYVAMNSRDLPFPFKRYQIGKVFRGESPQKGRFREFYQCDIDVIGRDKLPIAYDAEFPNIIYLILKELGIPNFQIQMNNRKLLSGFFESIEMQERSVELMRVIDKVDKLTQEQFTGELIVVLSVGKNMNGDDAEGVKQVVEKVQQFIKITSLEELLLLDIKNETFLNGVSEIKTLFENLLIPKEFYSLNLKIARGLDYYTGTVYETFITSNPEFGSICSGGRYDNLASCYTKDKYPGVGISIGLTRLFDRFVGAGLLTFGPKSPIDYLIIPMSSDALPEAQRLGNKLRDEDKKIDVFVEDLDLKKKIAYANKLGIQSALLVFVDKVLIKDMKTGEQTPFTI